MASSAPRGSVPLSQQLLETMSVALSRGAFTPVIDVLQSQPASAFGTFPVARLLLARAHFDAGHYDEALAELAQIKGPQPLDAAACQIRARVQAAQGHPENAERALEQARQMGHDNVELWANRLCVQLTLCRWQSAAEEAQRCRDWMAQQSGIGAADDLPSLCRLTSNLVSLGRWQPALAERLARWRPWDRMFLGEHQGTLTPVMRTGADPAPLFDPEAQLRREQKALSRCQADISFMAPVLVLGLGTGQVVNELGQVPAQVGKRLAILVASPADEDLAGALLAHDWAALIDDRVIHFLAAEPDELESYLREDLRRVPRTYRYATCANAPDTFTSAYRRQVEAILARLASEADAKIVSLEAYYGSDDFRGRWARQLSNAAGERLRVMIQTCRYTTFIYHNCHQLAEALGNEGFDVTILEEGTEQSHWLGPAYIQDQIAAERPDVLMRVNFLRQEEPARMPQGLPMLTWVQDYCPAHVDSCSARLMTARDYLTGFSKQGLLEIGYTKSHYLIGTVPCRAKTYAAPARGGRSYEHDVCYVSHQSTPPERFLERFRHGRRPPAEARWVEELYDRMKQSYANGEVIYNPILQYGDEYVDALVPQPRPSWVHGDALRLADLFYRQQCLQWIADAGFNLSIFGNGWSEHPTLARHARGPIRNGSDLRELYRSSRINLHLSASASLHQRVIDGFLAGGFMLLPRHSLYLPQLRCLRPRQHRELFELLSREPLTTYEELRDHSPEAAEYLIRAARESEFARQPGLGTAEERAFAVAESDLVQFVELRLPGLESVRFAGQEELIARLQEWLPQDHEREAFVASIQDSAGLKTLTTEFMVDRLTRWLAQRVGSIDLAQDLPKPFEDWPEKPKTGTGDYREGAPDGAWLFESEDGGLRLTGEYRAGLPSGTWIQECADGRREAVLDFIAAAASASKSAQAPEKSRHEQSTRRAHWRKWHPNGQLACQGEFRGNDRCGLWTTWHENGVKASEGKCRDNKADGLWLTWHDNGQLESRGHYHYGPADGEWQHWHPNGCLKMMGQFRNSGKEGLWQEWQEDGTPIRAITYSRGALEGLWTSWHPSGHKQASGEIHKGRRQGHWTFWHDNGQRRFEGQFVDGAREGQWKRWDRKGAFRVTYEYHLDQPCGPWMLYHANGAKWMEIEHQDGLREGLCIRWYPSGAIRSRSYWRSGKRHGTTTRYYADGTVQSVKEYEDGTLIGTGQETGESPSSS